MDYEKKYKEALEIARKINSGEGVPAPNGWSVCEIIFPELKESEDERIRKALIHIVKGACSKYGIKYQGKEIGEEKLLAWLEKREDTNETINRDEFAPKSATEAIKEKKVESKDYSSIDPFFFKTIDKVEPRFKAGDWIIHHGTENIYQVVAVIDNQYQLKYGDNYTIQNCADVDRCARLWDISKDAKEPYVISTNRELLSLQHEAIGWLEDHKQFAAKDDIQYIQDCIEKIRAIQLPQWSEEDEQYKINIASILNKDKTIPTNMYFRLCDWLRTLKERVQPQPKQDWSKEDEEMLACCEIAIDFFKNLGKNSSGHPHPNYFDLDEKIYPERVVAWLKSLKDRVWQQNKWKESLATADLENSLCDIQDRFSDTSYEYRILGEAIEFIRCTEPKQQWKPSDEQIEVLENVRKILHTNKDIYSKVNNLMYNFEELIRTLKKLREE